MADYIQKDSPLRFPEAGTDWFEEVGVGTGTPVTANDLIGSTLTYTYNNNTIIYDYDEGVDTWTGRVTVVASTPTPTESLWKEVGNALTPKKVGADLTIDGTSKFGGDVKIGGTSAAPNITMTAAGKITAKSFDIEALPALSTAP